MKIVKVTWIDSEQTPGWQMRSDVDATADKPCTLCVSVGFLIHEDRRSVLLAESVNPHNYGNPIKIPRIAVKKVEELAEHEDG